MSLMAFDVLRTTILYTSFEVRGQGVERIGFDLKRNLDGESSLRRRISQVSRLTAGEDWLFGEEVPDTICSLAP
jgi:hypothetical protein